MNSKQNKIKVDIKEVNEVVSLSKKILNLFYAVMIVVIVLIVSYLLKEWGVFSFILEIFSVISPFFIGFIIAWLFNPLVKKIEKKGIPRALSSIIVYAIFIAIIAIILKVLIPILFNQVNELINNIPSLIDACVEFINNIFTRFEGINGFDVENAKDTLISTITSLMSGFTTSLPTAIIGVISSLFSSLITIVFGLVIGLYMLFDFDALNRYFINILPRKNRFEASLLISNMSTEVRKSINGTLLVASMVFVCDSIGFAIVGLQAPVLFGLFCGITDLIPYIGPYIGGAAAVVVAFSQGPMTGFAVLAICVVVQCIENMILQPIVMSKTMKLHPVTIIAGLLIFQHFFGIIGMILATPCIALIKVIYRFVVEKFDLTRKETNIVLTDKVK